MSTNLFTLTPLPHHRSFTMCRPTLSPACVLVRRDACVLCCHWMLRETGRLVVGLLLFHSPIPGTHTAPSSSETHIFGVIAFRAEDMRCRLYLCGAAVTIVVVQLKHTHTQTHTHISIRLRASECGTFGCEDVRTSVNSIRCVQ